MYLTFHQTRGRLEFYGCIDFQEIITLNDVHLFQHNRDERGRFCTPFLTDHAGNIVCDDVTGKTGRLDFDGKFDTWNTIEIEGFEELDEREALAILKTRWYTGISDEQKQEIRELFGWED